MFANLNVPKNMDTAKRFWVQDYPLLLMFRHGKRYNYTGPMMDIDGRSRDSHMIHSIPRYHRVYEATGRSQFLGYLESK